MKVLTLTLAFFCMACCGYAQTAFPISFDLAGKTIQAGAPAITYTGDTPIAVTLGVKDNIVFSVNPGGIQQYTLQFRKGPNLLFTLDQRSFTNGKLATSSMATDTSWRLQNNKLPRNFTVTLLQGSNVLIKGLFAVKLSSAAGPGGPLNSPPVTKQQPVTTPGLVYKPGYMYYDALALTNYAALDDSAFWAILAYYHGDTVQAAVVKMVESNPFLRLQIDSATMTSKLANYEKRKAAATKPGVVNSQAAGTLASAAFGAVGGLDVTNIVDGLAKFLVKRAKQELSVAFFEKFQQIISDTVKFKDLHTVFPATYGALQVIGDQIYNYDGYIQSLRDAFEQDLSNLTTNLPSIIDNHAVFFSKPENRKLAVILQSGCYIAGALRDKTHPGEILANYPVDYLDSMPAEWRGSLVTLKLISKSLRDTTSADSAYWVSFQKFGKLAGNTKSMGIYLGLLYEQAKTADTINGNVAPIYVTDSVQVPDTIKVSIAKADSAGKIDTTKKDSIVMVKKPGLRLTDVLDKVAPNYNAATKYITQVANKASKLETLLKQYKRTTNDSLLIQQYYNYFTAAIDLLRQCSMIQTIPAFKTMIKPDLSKVMQPYFDVASAAGNLVLDISKRSYSAAILQVTHIYDVIQADKDAAVGAVLQPKDGKAVDQLKQVNIQLSLVKTTIAAGAADSAHKALSAAVDQLSKAVNLVADSVKIVPGTTRDNIFKYGSFMSAVVLAKNSDDVESAIEAIALPSGSSRIKRETPFNVALNAYPGLFIGHEFINGISDAKTFNSFGVTAQIGVAVSVGKQRFLWFGDYGKGHWSYSLFVSLIDIGAAAAYRFGDQTTASVPTIELKDILAPGGYFSIGIPKCPLSINLGAQLGPNLRKVYGQTGTTQSNDYANQTYWRLSAALCVDIPMFNFFTKTN